MVGTYQIPESATHQPAPARPVRPPRRAGAAQEAFRPQPAADRTGAPLRAQPDALEYGRKRPQAPPSASAGRPPEARAATSRRAPRGFVRQARETLRRSDRAGARPVHFDRRQERRRDQPRSQTGDARPAGSRRCRSRGGRKKAQGLHPGGHARYPDRDNLRAAAGHYTGSPARHPTGARPPPVRQPGWRRPGPTGPMTGALPFRPA
jgi:hypothetical protein